MLPQVPGFNQMGAVKAGRVVELDPVLFLQAQGPRIADAVEEMLRLMNEVAS
jgi:ABC-type hemin transport system substrate-binding protein